MDATELCPTSANCPNLENDFETTVPVRMTNYYGFESQLRDIQSTFTKVVMTRTSSKEKTDKLSEEYNTAWKTRREMTIHLIYRQDTRRFFFECLKEFIHSISLRKAVLKGKNCQMSSQVTLS